jgi:hypothetical protein
LLIVELARVWRAMAGEKLLITSITDPDVTVSWSENPFFFLLGLAMHGAILALVGGALFSQYRFARKWLAARGAGIA